MTSGDIIPFKARDSELTEARLERALMAVAWLITRHGAVYAPIFERLEQELIAMRRSSNPIDRARQYLAANTIEIKSLKAA